MSAQEHLGSQVIIVCGSGVFNGVIASVDAGSQSLTLNRCVRNGVMLLEPVTIKANEISDLKIIKTNIPSLPADINGLTNNENEKERTTHLVAFSQHHEPFQQSATTSAFNLRKVQTPDGSLDRYRNCERRQGSQASNFRDYYKCGVSPMKLKNTGIGARGKTKNLNEFLEQPLNKNQMKDDFDFEANLALFDKISFKESERNDASARGKTKNINEFLEQPLNRNQMKEDFDFEANLALFDKISSKESGRNDASETLTQKISAKDSDRRTTYRHDENILLNPNQIYQKAKSVRTFKDKNGIIIPSMTRQEKKLCLQECLIDETFIEYFAATFALSVCQCIFHVIDPTSMSWTRFVILEDETSDVARKISAYVRRHLTNRKATFLTIAQHKTIDSIANVALLNFGSPNLPVDFIGSEEKLAKHRFYVECEWNAISEQKESPPHFQYNHVIFWQLPASDWDYFKSDSMKFYVCDVGLNTHYTRGRLKGCDYSFGSNFFVQIERF